MKSRQHTSDRLGLHGSFWTRVLLRLLRIFPVWICLAGARPLALAFFTLASGQRAALKANIKALHPGWGPVRLWWAGYQVFLQFALTYMDRLWSLHLRHPVRWEFQNPEHLAAQLESPGGLILFTAHSGNYDIGAAMFAEHFPRRLHIVRMPERSQNLQEFRARELEQVGRRHANLRVHYCTDEWALGLELCQLLQAGEAVAVQGDRILADSPSIPADYDGVTFALPRGPLALAQIARAACCPVFLTRVARCHYRLRSCPPFYDGAGGARMEDMAKNWLAVLAPFVREHWAQWFVFEPMLGRANADDPRTLAVSPCQRELSARCE